MSIEKINSYPVIVSNKTRLQNTENNNQQQHHSKNMKSAAVLSAALLSLASIGQAGVFYGGYTAQKNLLCEQRMASLPADFKYDKKALIDAGLIYKDSFMGYYTDNTFDYYDRIKNICRNPQLREYYANNLAYAIQMKLVKDFNTEPKALVQLLDNGKNKFEYDGHLFRRINLPEPTPEDDRVNIAIFSVLGGALVCSTAALGTLLITNK